MGLGKTLTILALIVGTLEEAKEWEQIQVCTFQVCSLHATIPIIRSIESKELFSLVRMSKT